MKSTWLHAVPVLLLNMPLWLIYGAVSVALGLIGIPLVTLAALGRQWEFMPSKVWPDRTIRRWWHLARWMNAIYGNEQEGIDGLYDENGKQAWWRDRKFRDIAARIIAWSAFRNATNNLRFVHHFSRRLKWVNPNTIEPARVRYVTHKHGWICWQGPYAGMQLGRFWVGWKVRPEHSDPAWWPDDPCWKGIGFTAGRKAA